MQTNLSVAGLPREKWQPDTGQSYETAPQLQLLEPPGTAPPIPGQRAAKARLQTEQWHLGPVAQARARGPRHAHAPLSRVTPQMRNFAKRLIAYDELANNFSADKTPAAFHVCDKLRPHFTTLMGSGGFRAVFSRSLTLAKAEVPWLRAVQVKTDGSLEGLEELHAQLDPNRYLEVRVVLLAQLLGLLVAFIGEALTLRLVGEVWPKAPFNDLDFAHGDKK